MCPEGRESTNPFLECARLLVRQENCGLKQGGLRTSHLFGPVVDSEQEPEGRLLTYQGVGARQKCEPIYVHLGVF